MKFHNFGPGPPPPKSCETSIFFLLHDQKKYYVQIKKNSPLKTQKNYEKVKYSVENYLSFQSILVRGYPYPLEKNFFLAVMDELEHAQKNKKKL